MGSKKTMIKISVSLEVFPVSLISHLHGTTAFLIMQVTAILDHVSTTAYLSCRYNGLFDHAYLLFFLTCGRRLRYNPAKLLEKIRISGIYRFYQLFNGIVQAAIIRERLLIRDIGSKPYPEGEIFFIEKYEAFIGAVGK